MYGGILSRVGLSRLTFAVPMPGWTTSGSIFQSCRIPGRGWARHAAVDGGWCSRAVAQRALCSTIGSPSPGAPHSETCWRARGVDCSDTGAVLWVPSRMLHMHDFRYDLPLKPQLEERGKTGQNSAGETVDVFARCLSLVVHTTPPQGHRCRRPHGRNTSTAHRTVRGTGGGFHPA